MECIGGKLFTIIYLNETFVQHIHTMCITALDVTTITYRHSVVLDPSH